MTTTDTTPSALYTISDTTIGDTIDVLAGPVVGGAQTVDVRDGAGATDLAYQSEIEITGDSLQDVVLGDPDVTAGLETLDIVDALTIDNSGPGLGIDVPTLDLAAVGAIGASDQLQTQVDTLNAQAGGTGSDNININNGVLAAVTLTVTGMSAGGAIDLTNDGTIDNYGGTVLGAGSVNITASTGDLNTGSGGEIISTGGSVVLTTDAATGNINIGDEEGNSVVADAGIFITAGGNFTVEPDDVVINAASGDISINAGGNITMLTEAGGSASAPLIQNQASTGTITLTAGAGKTLTIANNSAGTAVESSNGDISLFADNMAIDAPINSGSATTVLAPVTSNREIELGVGISSAALGLTQGELDEITAGIVRIGSITAGSLLVEAPISQLTGSTTLALETGLSVFENGSSTTAAVTATDLEVSAGNDVDLLAHNDIGTIAGAAGGNFQVVNAPGDPLTIGSVDFTSGIALTGTDTLIFLQADDLSIDSGLSAPDGTVLIEPASATAQVDLGGTSGNSGTAVLGISETELGAVLAETLQVISPTSITLFSIANQNYLTLDLVAGTSITQTASTALSIGVLQLTADTGITVDQSGNAFSELSFTNESGTVDIADGISGTLTVDASNNYGTTTTTLSTGGALTLDALFSGGGAAITASSIALDGGISAGEPVALTAETGAITDASDGADVDITAPAATLSATTGIGTSASAPLDTEVGTLTALTNTGGIFIANGVSAPTTLNIGSNGFGIEVTLSSGNIDLTNDSTIDSTNDDQITGPGSITVEALGSGSDLNISGEAELGTGSVDATGSGAITLSAGRDVTLGGSATLGSVNAASGSISITAGRNFSINPQAGVNVQAGTGGVTIAAGGNFTMTTTPNVVVAGGPVIATSAGSINLSAGAGATMTLATTGGDGAVVAEDGGNITLNADNLAIDAVVGTDGTVTIQPVSAGQLISLGTATGGLTLDASDLNNIQAEGLTIGDATAGEVQIAGTVSPPTVTNLTIDTGAGFTEAAGSVINIGAGSLTIEFGQSGAGVTGDFTNLAITSGPVVITAGTGDDTFKFTAAELVGTDTVAGAGTIDRLVMTTAGTINAGGVAGIEIYDLANGGANTLTLTNANFGGVHGKITVNGGSGGNTINAAALTGSDLVNLIGGGGNDTFDFSAASLAAGDTVVGGGGTDHLIMTTAGTINAGGVSGIGIYDLAGGGANTLTLTNANFAGVAGGRIIVNGGSGGNTINAAALTATDLVNLLGGAGNDTFDFSVAGLGAGDEVVGGGGTDHLIMTTAGTINASDVSGVGIYNLSGGAVNALTLTGANFTGVAGGRIIVNGGSGGNTINAAALTASNLVNLVGGAGNDTFEFSAAGLAAGDEVMGGGGTDHLIMTTAGTVHAGDVSGVGIYDLAGGGANTLTLTNANFTGVTGSKITVNGGSGGNTINAAALTGSNQVSVVGGAGNDVFTAGQHAAMTGGGGGDIFGFTTPGTLAQPDTNTITDFNSSTDEITFSDAGFSLGLAGASSTPTALPSTLFTSNSAGSFTSTAQRFAYDTSTGALHYDSQGNTAGSSSLLVATLSGHPALTASDLFYVT